jgi:hypothetical protein
VWLLTEAGLYRFLLASRNKLAKLFADWVLFDVIPSIRRTGKYEVSGDDRKKLEASNAALEAKLLETEKQHDEAQAYLRSKVQELGESLKNADVDREAQGYIVNELRETVAEAEAGKENDQKLFEDAQLALKEAEEHAVDLCQRYEDVSAEMAGAEEDLEVVTGYLQQFGGMNNVAAVLSHGYKEAADPMVNRNRLITLRAAAFGILHTCSFMLVKGFEEAHGRKMTGRELDAAVEQIMDSDNVVVPIRGRSNWIVLYTTLARIAKKRLVDSADGDEKDKRKKYSTEMPIAHLYRYSKNLNAWAAGALKMEQCVSYDKEIEAFYGKDSVEQFDFAKVEYDEIRAELEKNQPLITQFFA